MDKHLIDYYAAPVPRYTSYPTAPHFHQGVDAKTHAGWIAALPAGAKLSLYIHIPYCDRLCWFCGCTTKQTNRYAPVATFLESLYKEIDMVAGLLAGRGVVTALHFGGGSPTLLTPEDMRKVNALLREKFFFASDAEISVEMDPNDMDAARYDALAQIGLTRASLGVQDFDLKVQEAINRLQSFEQTRDVVDAMRARGVYSVNLDVLYGLPHQTEATIEKTIADVLSLDPDRVALFGYAHVPWMKKHQRMIDEAALPNIYQRHAQQKLAAAMLVEAGYQPIGIDHFAKPGDSLAIAARQGTLRRNFQGYTTDNAEALIGLGASSISQFPQGYVQNSPASGDYERRIGEGALATVKGIALSEEDRLRGAVIEKIMCQFGFSADALAAEFGEGARAVIADAERLVASEPHGFFSHDKDRYFIPEAGQGFARTIAAHFDTYLATGKARHSVAV